MIRAWSVSLRWKPPFALSLSFFSCTKIGRKAAKLVTVRLPMVFERMQATRIL